MRYTLNPADAEDATRKHSLGHIEDCNIFAREAGSILGSIDCEQIAPGIVESAAADLLNSAIDFSDDRTTGHPAWACGEWKTPEELMVTDEIFRAM